ncbi:MAG: hypothetical protein LBG76_05430 [Treponema sp.]|jgi:hypothetical protein|nr:hypothetical protein [Treponema sp.]
MADKLDWLNKHLVLIRYTSLSDVIEKEGYKIRPDLAELFKGETGAEAMIGKFADVGRFKCACELMAYTAHRRAAVWWGYRCVLSLMEELRINPAEERDIADIGASLEPEVPDFAKIKPPEPNPALIAKAKADVGELEAELQKAREQIDPRILKVFDEALEAGYQKFKSIHGIHPLDLIKKLGERIGEDEHPIDPNSPIFQEAAKLKAQLAAVQKETVETIKSVIPPKVPEHEKKVRDNALAAVFRWVAAPDAENSQKCLDIGNECPDTPAGLLSLSSFWAYGDLLPLGEQPVPTPPGLAANGLCQVFLLCALHQGGTRKVKERYEEYFRLGFEVLTGADNWEAPLAAGKAPHEDAAFASANAGGGSGAQAPTAQTDPAASPSPAAENGKGAAAPEPSAGGNADAAPPPAYKRWKPEGDVP